MSVEWSYLSIWCIGFVSNEQKIVLILDADLFLESSAFGRFFLHVRSGQESMDQGGFAAGQRSEKTNTNVQHTSTQRPFLTVDKRI